MAKITKVSVWSISLRRTDKGYQARVFPRSSKEESWDHRPIFYNSVELGTLLDTLKEEIPKLSEELIDLRYMQQKAA